MNVFVSYRREDSQHVADRIAEWLVRDLGQKHVFKDVDSIPLGHDFRRFIRTAVTRCDALVAIVGRDWLTVRDPTGARRIDDPGDWVRIEIGAALERSIPVIPLFVNGALPPRASDLPEELQGIAYRNGMPVRPDPDFRGDMERLLRTLSAINSATPPGAEDKTAATARKPPRPVATPTVAPVAKPPPEPEPEVLPPPRRLLRRLIAILLVPLLAVFSALFIAILFSGEERSRKVAVDLASQPVPPAPAPPGSESASAPQAPAPAAASDRPSSPNLTRLLAVSPHARGEDPIMVRLIIVGPLEEFELQGLVRAFEEVPAFVHDVCVVGTKTVATETSIKVERAAQEAGGRAKVFFCSLSLLAKMLNERPPEIDAVVFVGHYYRRLDPTFTYNALIDALVQCCKQGNDLYVVAQAAAWDGWDPRVQGYQELTRAAKAHQRIVVPAGIPGATDFAAFLRGIQLRKPPPSAISFGPA